MAGQMQNFFVQYYYLPIDGNSMADKETSER